MVRLFARLVAWVDDQDGWVKLAVLLVALAVLAFVVRAVCSAYIGLSYYNR